MVDLEMLKVAEIFDVEDSNNVCPMIKKENDEYSRIPTFSIKENDKKDISNLILSLVDSAVEESNQIIETNLLERMNFTEAFRLIEKHNYAVIGILVNNKNIIEKIFDNTESLWCADIFYDDCIPENCIYFFPAKSCDGLKYVRDIKNNQIGIAIFNPKLISKIVVLK